MMFMDEKWRIALAIRKRRGHKNSIRRMQMKKSKSAGAG